jgi:hypothetical protein
MAALPAARVLGGMCARYRTLRANRSRLSLDIHFTFIGEGLAWSKRCMGSIASHRHLHDRSARFGHEVAVGKLRDYTNDVFALATLENTPNDVLTPAPKRKSHSPPLSSP